MEAKFSQSAGDFAGLLGVKLNPNPLTDDFGQFVEVRGPIAEQVQQVGRVQRTIRHAASEIDLWSVSGAKLFGSALESRIRILSCCFHGLIFVLCCSVSVSRPSPQKPAQQGGQRE